MSRFMSRLVAAAAHVRDGDAAALERFTHLIPMPPVTR
jgi:hypothetical protein